MFWVLKKLILASENVKASNKFEIEESQANDEFIFPEHVFYWLDDYLINAD